MLEFDSGYEYGDNEVSGMGHEETRPDNSLWGSLYMVFKQERSDPVRQGESARVAGCFQWRLGLRQRSLVS